MKTAAPYLALASAALFWSGNFIVGRALRGDVPPISLNFWRWVVALMILLPLSYGQLRQYRLLLLKEWKLLVALGLTGVAAFQVCVYIALRSTTAVNALLLLSLAPVVIVWASWLAFRDSVTPRQQLGMAVSLLGAGVLIAKGNLTVLLTLNFSRGDVWMLLAIVIWALYSILLKRRPKELPHLALLTASVIAGLVLLLPAYLLTLAYQHMTVNAPNILGIFYIALFASVLAFLAWNSGVARLGPNRAGMFIHLMPVFGAVLSFFLLGEGVQLFHLYGALLVFAGIGLMNWPVNKVATTAKKAGL